MTCGHTVQLESAPAVLGALDGATLTHDAPLLPQPILYLDEERPETSYRRSSCTDGTSRMGATVWLLGEIEDGTLDSGELLFHRSIPIAPGAEQLFQTEMMWTPSQPTLDSIEAEARHVGVGLAELIDVRIEIFFEEQELSVNSRFRALGPRERTIEVSGFDSPELHTAFVIR